MSYHKNVYVEFTYFVCRSSLKKKNKLQMKKKNYISYKKRPIRFACKWSALCFSIDALEDQSCEELKLSSSIIFFRLLCSSSLLEEKKKTKLLHRIERNYGIFLSRNPCVVKVALFSSFLIGISMAFHPVF